MMDFSLGSLPELPSGKQEATEQTAISDHALQKHVLKVQETLLDSVDRQVSNLENKVHDSESRVKEALEQKKEIALGFYKLKQEHSRALKRNHRLAKRATHLETEKRLVESSAQSLKRQIIESQSEAVAAKNEEHKAKNVAEEYIRKLGRMQDLNMALATDLKVQSHVQQILKRESEALNSKRRQAERQAQESQKEAETLKAAKSSLETSFHQQKQDAAVLQNTLGKVNRELFQLQQVKTAMEKQWTDTLQAMSKRDVTMQAMQQSKEKALLELEEAKQKVKAYKEEKDLALKQLHAKEIGDKTFTAGMQDLEAQLEQIQEKAKSQTRELELAKRSQDVYKVSLEKVQHSLEQVSEAALRKQHEAANYKKQLQDAFAAAKLEKEDAVRNTIFDLEGKLSSKYEEKVEKLSSVLANDSFQVRRENAQLKLGLQLREQLDTQQAHNLKQTENKYKDSRELVQSLTHDVKILSSTLERRDHEIHLMQARLENKRVKDNQVPALKSELANLNKALVIARQEQDTIQSTWLATKKEALKDKLELDTLRIDYDNSKVNLSVAHLIKESALQEVDVRKKQSAEDQIQIAQAQLENKRLYPELKKLKQNQLALESAAQNERINTQVARIEGKTAVQVLRAQVEELQKSKIIMKKNQNLDLKTHMAMEKRLTLLKAMLDKEISQRKIFASENAQLKQRVVNTEKNLTALKTEYQKYIELSLKRSAERRVFPSNSLISEIQPETESYARTNEKEHNSPNVNSFGTVENEAWRELLSKGEEEKENEIYREPDVSYRDPGKAAAIVLNDDPEQEFKVPNLHHLKLKLNSLRKEKSFLTLENGQLTAKLEQMKLRLQEVEEVGAQSEKKRLSLETEAQNTANKLSLLARQFEKATNLAAFIEQQFKEAVPNVRINYNPSKFVDPSTQILGALMYKE